MKSRSTLFTMNCTSAKSPLGLLKLLITVNVSNIFAFNQIKYFYDHPNKIFSIQPNKIFLLCQAVLVSIVLLSYYGNEGGRLFFGLLDYLGVGITVGFCIVVPLIFFTYLCDGNILIFVSLYILKVIVDRGINKVYI